MANDPQDIMEQQEPKLPIQIRLEAMGGNWFRFDASKQSWAMVMVAAALSNMPRHFTGSVLEGNGDEWGVEFSLPYHVIYLTPEEAARVDAFFPERTAGQVTQNIHQIRVATDRKLLPEEKARRQAEIGPLLVLNGRKVFEFAVNGRMVEIGVSVTSGDPLTNIEMIGRFTGLLVVTVDVSVSPNPLTLTAIEQDAFWLAVADRFFDSTAEPPLTPTSAEQQELIPRTPDQRLRRRRRRPGGFLETVVRNGCLLIPNNQHFYGFARMMAGGLEIAADSPYPTMVRDSVEVTILPEGVKSLPDISSSDVSPAEFTAWVNKMREIEQSERKRQGGERRLIAWNIAISAYLKSPRDKDGNVEVYIDDLLAIRGIQPKTKDGYSAGYREEGRLQMLEDLRYWDRLWVEMDVITGYTRPKKNGEKGRPIEEARSSRALVIIEEIGQRRFDGSVDVHSIIYRPGGKLFKDCIDAIAAAGGIRQVALLPLTAVQLNPYMQWREIRLLRFLAYDWRVNAKNGGSISRRSVRYLLEHELQETIDLRYLSRIKEQFERALEWLQDNKDIRGWQYAAGRWDDSRMQSRGWQNVWLDALVVIEAPENIKDYNRNIHHQHAPTPPAGGSTVTGKDLSARLLEARRLRNNLPQLRASEEIGIPQYAVSRIEKGVRPRPDTAEKIERWLKRQPDPAPKGGHEA